jgi:predicted kinase
MLVIFRGLPGTGKSYLVSRLIAERPAFHVVSRDALRAAVFPHPTFSEEEKSLVDDLVGVMAGFLLERGKDVVIDGMALSSAARVGQLVTVARDRNVPAKIVECVCRQDTALSRISGDDGSHPAGDRGEALYVRVKARFQAVSHPSLIVDTDAPTESNVAAILAYLAEQR